MKLDFTSDIFSFEEGHAFFCGDAVESHLILSVVIEYSSDRELDRGILAGENSHAFSAHRR